MGLSSKQVHGDEGLDNWSQTLLKEMESADNLVQKPASIRRQQQQRLSEALDCPRCGSSNTKFCYYNNYNKSQPRHFCKACKRHWTKGGTLRNVPVGGGRKNKRLKVKAITTTTISDSDRKKNNNNINVAHHQQHHHHQKNISDILYQALVKGSDDHPNNNNNGSLLLPIPAPSEDHQNHQFSLFSSLTTPFDDNSVIIPSALPTFHQSSFIINDEEDDDFYDGKKLLDSTVESSTITTTAANTSSISSSIFFQPPAWQQKLGPTTTAEEEMQNFCWNWNVDIDTLVSAGDHQLNIPLPWDDDNTEMKP